MKNGQRSLRAHVVQACLLALLAGAQAAQAQAQANNFPELQGFGEGVAAALMTSTPVRARRSVQGPNGRVTLQTYRQNGLALQAMTGGPRAFPASLLIARPGYPLPMGLRIGDARGAVERTLGLAAGSGDTVVLRRTQGEGCDDPITLRFRDGHLTQVAWTWETCMD